MSAPLLVTFAAAELGPWKIDPQSAVLGDNLPLAPHLVVTEGLEPPASTAEARWDLAVDERRAILEEQSQKLRETANGATWSAKSTSG